MTPFIQALLEAHHIMTTAPTKATALQASDLIKDIALEMLDLEKERDTDHPHL